MNQDQTTRKDQIYRRLKASDGGWVDGTDLATAEVGGSEGLRRLRELRTDLAKTGAGIQQRRHPDPKRDIWQYRLVEKPDVSPGRGASSLGSKPGKLVFGRNFVCSYCTGSGKKHGQECDHCDGRGWM